MLTARTTSARPAKLNLRRLETAVALLDKNGGGGVWQCGTYTLGKFTAPVYDLQLLTLGLSVRVHELPGGTILANVRCDREIRIKTEGMLPVRDQANSKRGAEKLSSYGEDHARFSAILIGGFEDFFGRIVAGAALCENKECLSLAEWVGRNRPNKAISDWATDALAQFDLLENLRKAGLKADPQGSVLNVVGSHPSKSVFLPVVSLSTADPGLRLWLSNNFNAWGVTVEADSPLEHLDTSGFTIESKRYNPVNFSGFERADVPIYGPYGKSPAQFSFLYDADKPIVPIFQRLIEAAKR